MSTYDGQIFWYGTLTQRQGWRVDKLWALAESCPIKSVPLEEFSALLNEQCWFREKPPTNRAVLEKAKEILDADLAYPIILSSAGIIMDGRHRIMKAWLLGRAEIKAVQFEVDPDPDEVWTGGAPTG